MVWASQVVLIVKNPPTSAGDSGDTGSIPELGRSPEKEMATRSRILAWEILWTKEPGGLRSMGSLTADTIEQAHARAHTHTHTHT